MDRRPHHLDAHASDENADELQAGDDDQDEDRVLDSLSFAEIIVLACLVEEAAVDDGDLYNDG